MAVDEASPTTVVAVARGAVAEAVGTALLVAIVVGSGTFAQQLTTDKGLQLLENSLATTFGLMALILAFGKVSGAHFNPVVTLADRFLGGVDTSRALAYIGAQIAGGCVGTIIANLMFDLPAVPPIPAAAAGSGSASSSPRSGCSRSSSGSSAPGGRRRHRSPSGRTSGRPTGSPRRPASPTRRSRSGGC